MLKIPSKVSASISLVFAVLIFAALVLLAVFLAPLLSFFMEVFSKPEGYFIPTLVLLYTALLPAFAADACLWRLLRNIAGGQIFTDSSVACLRGLSWLCMAETVIFFILGFYYVLMFCLAFAAVFMGIILRVVKNVMEEAAAMKAENDYTI